MKRLLVMALVVLVIALGLGGWWWTRQSLPMLDGQLGMPGLKDPVEVVFDGYGVPHVYARDPEDVWFAAGVLHARERFWQMELYRRVTAGRLSEMLGESTLPIDKRFLTLDLRAAAEAEWKRVSPEVRAALERYAAGVNAVTSGWLLRQRPLEMQVLGIVPGEWTPTDTLAVGRLLAWRLAENHQSELVRAAVSAKLGPEASRQLAGRYPADAPVIVGGVEATSTDESGAGVSSPPAPIQQPSSSAASVPPVAWPAGLDWLQPMARRGNSNSWVLSGARTATGRPLLANDPHLQVEFPALWYEMHLVAAGLDVTGVTMPGVPFVIIGHNRRIAWGFTNSGADVQDLAVERIDVGRKRYLSDGGWQPARVTRVEIPVRGRTPESFDVWRTAHGPLIADASSLDWEAPPTWMTPSSEAPPPGQVTAYALRWEGLDGNTAGAFETLDRAQDWTGFQAAVDAFDSPSQNIVYADVDGNIGYALNGRLPVRSSGDGTLPTAGGSGAWAEGGMPPALPRVLNPASGFIITANNEIERGSGVLITRDWAAHYRAARLREVLAPAQGVTLDAMAALQNDTRSPAAERVLAGVKQALATAATQNADSAVVNTLTELASWDHIVDGRPVVTLYQAFEDALWRRTFADDMDEALFRAFYRWAGGERPAGLHAIIDERQSRWFDDIATVDKRESRDDIFILAARDAAERVEAEFGSGSGRAWDRVHAVPFEHPLGQDSYLMSWLFSRGSVPMPGDGTTVLRVSWDRLAPFTGWEIPSWRQLLDVGDWDQSRVVLPAGQSGHRLSAYAFDQNELWRSGGYRPQPFSRQAVLDAQAHRLLLVP